MLIDLVTSEKERKKSSIVVVVAGNLAVYAPPISVTPRFTAAAYFRAGTIPYFQPNVPSQYVTIMRDREAHDMTPAWLPRSR